MSNNDEMLHGYSSRTLSPILACGLVVCACGGGEPSEQVGETPLDDESARVTPEAPPPPIPATPPPAPVREQDAAEAAYLYGTRWAPGAEGKLILGLDGGEYPPYRGSVIREVQRFLFDSELYDGPETGVLDEQTMQALAAFQKENGIVQSGVPSPETRDAMRNAMKSDQPIEGAI